MGPMAALCLSMACIVDYVLPESLLDQLDHVPRSVAGPHILPFVKQQSISGGSGSDGPRELAAKLVEKIAMHDVNGMSVSLHMCLTTG